MPTCRLGFDPRFGGRPVRGASGSCNRRVPRHPEGAPARDAPARSATGHGIAMVVCKAVSSVAFSPNGRLLASGSWGGSVKLWDPFTGKPLRTLGLLPGGEARVGDGEGCVTWYSPGARRWLAWTGGLVRFPITAFRHGEGGRLEVAPAPGSPPGEWGYRISAHSPHRSGRLFHRTSGESSRMGARLDPEKIRCWMVVCRVLATRPSLAQLLLHGGGGAGGERGWPLSNHRK